MQEVQAIILNIAFPKSLEEVLDIQNDHGYFDIEALLMDSEEKRMEAWTAPKWSKIGDIVFFMHSKSSGATIARLKNSLKRQSDDYTTDDFNTLTSALERASDLYGKYGGKIFALGQVSENPYQQTQEHDYMIHWKSRIYANISDCCCLESPVDRSDFNDFIQISSRSAITPVFGKEFEALKSLIMSKNAVPRYLEESVSMPIPLSKITGNNWIQIASQYRRSFFLEIQFRTYYVDYLLSSLGDRKGFFKECACIKGERKASFVDNVMVIGGKYLPVEVKLNIDTEKDLIGQLRKYCALDKLVLDTKKQRFAAPEKVYGDGLLVIDTNGAYWYDNSEQSVSPIRSLDDIFTQQDISNLREAILTLMAQSFRASDS